MTYKAVHVLVLVTSPTVSSNTLSLAHMALATSLTILEHAYLRKLAASWAPRAP